MEAVTTDCNDDCEEYYRRRAAEVTEWMESQLRSVAERDQLFVGLLRVAIERRVERNGQVERELRNRVAGARGKLRAATDLAKAVVRRSRSELDQFANGFWVNDDNLDDDETAEELAAENDRLAANIRADREQLQKSLDCIRSAEEQLQRKQKENDKLKRLQWLQWNNPVDPYLNKRPLVKRN